MLHPPVEVAVSEADNQARIRRIIVTGPIAIVSARPSLPFLFGRIPTNKLKLGRIRNPRINFFGIEDFLGFGKRQLERTGRLALDLIAERDAAVEA